jgi:AcrR family transcriptional regulator
MTDSHQSIVLNQEVHPREPRPQERSLVTRQQLIDAARKIFARDGFEKASLQDISALAGKTRGAFYVHFNDKEDVFFAIFEQYVEEAQEQLLQRFQGASTRSKRLAALAAHLVAVIEDKERSVLALEFKMYVLRHPREQQRLAELHRAVCQRGCGPHLQALLPELAQDAGSPEFRCQSAQFGAIVDGLALNRLFDPGSLDAATLLRHVTAALHAMM